MSRPATWRNPKPKPPIGRSSESKFELAVAITLWLHLFLLIVVLVIGRSVGSALFLGKFDGQGLAGIYILVGLVVAALITLFDRVRLIATGPLASILTLLSLLGVTLGAGFLFLRPAQEHSPWVYGLFYLLVESFAFVTTVQFWGTANAALSLDLARRLYVFVATGGIFGSIVGGLLTRWISPLPTWAQIFVMAGIIPAQLLVLLTFDSLARRLARINPKAVDRWNLDSGAAAVGLPANLSSRTPGRAVDVEPPIPANEAVPTISGSAVLSLPFGMVSLLMVFSTTLVDYYYKMHADYRYLGDTRDLTWFFGSFYLSVGLTTLVTQLLVTPMILRHGTSFVGMWTSPLALAGMTILNLFWPGIWPAAVFKLTDSVLSHSVYRSCQEMLYTPLPTRWVHTLKAQADGVYGRYGLILSGLFLFVVSPFNQAAADEWLLFWILFSLVLWAGAIGWLRRTYRVEASPAQPKPSRARTLIDALGPRTERSFQQRGSTL